MRFLILLALLSISMAWDMYTAERVAQDVLLDKYPLCAEEIQKGVQDVYSSEEVDPALGEPENFHCDSLMCPAFDAAYCQTDVKTCPSEYVAGQVKSEVLGTCNCEQARILARAITYFIQKYDPMNLMVNEECHEDFDANVSEAIRNGSYEVAFHCWAPDRDFTFDSSDYEDMVFGAETFAFAGAYSGTDAWFCYNMEEERPEEKNLLPDGSLCSSDSECESGHCSNHICCSGERCCPTPEKRGYPCLDGEVCSEAYVCEPLNLENGEPCTSDAECLSGYCGSNAGGTASYCCSEYGATCCATDEDCYENEVCQNNQCIYVPSEENKTGESEGESEEGTCVLPFALLSLTVLGYAVRGHL